MATSQFLNPGRRVLASAPNLQIPLWGITLEHSQFSQTYWLINRPFSMNLTLEDTSIQQYQPGYFQLKLPNIDGKGQQDVSIAIQNVDRVLVDQVERASTMPDERVRATLRLFLEDDPTAGPQNYPLQLSFANVQATSEAVSGIAGRPDVLNRAFPTDIYRVTSWPGLDR